MCGIVGYVGSQSAASILLEGLKKLEYRGYDSAGIAILNEGKIDLRRAKGKLQALEALIQLEPLKGTIGIGHTRWATHGKPSRENAHPHQAPPITLVHNGIIENHLELRNELIPNGAHFSSETDTEVIAHLLSQNLLSFPSTLEALRSTLEKIRGSYALVVLNEKDPFSLFVARHQSPLVIGIGERENFVASDIPALLAHTRRIIFLEDGDCAQISQDKIEIYDRSGKAIERPVKTIHWSISQAEKGGHKHFMKKEILESAQSFIQTLQERTIPSHKQFVFGEGKKLFSAFFPQRVEIVACGSSYHAALLGKFYLEQFLKIPVTVDVASEFRYRNSLLNPQTLLVAISQSGETADTLVAVKNAKSQGAPVLSICNAVDSSIARESDAVFYTHAGPEIGVAATKTFLTQMEALLLLSLFLGQKQGTLESHFCHTAFDELFKIPQKIERILQQEEKIREQSIRYAQSKNFLFIGRGYQYPIALEGALKLKEISYIHSEGYPAGELKHGPIAMIEQETPVVALIPQDASYEKTLSNVQEVLAREASVIAIATEGDARIGEKAQTCFFVPQTLSFLYPLLTVIPLQLMAYEIANYKGYDVDQPRNLAKSVTVE